MATYKPFRPRAIRKNGVSRIIRDNYGPKWFDMVKEVRKMDTIEGQLICRLCRQPILPGEKAETHHLKALSKGGTTTMNNLGSVHERCHDSRHAHLAKRRGGKIS